MPDKKNREQNKDVQELSRRGFLKATGVVIVGAGAGLGVISCGSQKELISTYHIPSSQGYLLVDTKKCQGCLTCMMACSMVHEGETNLSLARIQILQDTFGKYPDDLTMETCRQCVDPACVLACPTGALKADTSSGNVRIISPERCIGCGRCVHACLYQPSRPVVAPESANSDREISRKCDLCLDTPYHWDERGGGPNGKQACVAVCPVGAIAFTSEIPEQGNGDGYEVNLRNPQWAKLGFPIDD